jgi:hypothetical protein
LIEFEWPMGEWPVAKVEELLDPRRSPQGIWQLAFMMVEADLENPLWCNLEPARQHLVKARELFPSDECWDEQRKTLDGLIAEMEPVLSETDFPDLPTNWHLQHIICGLGGIYTGMTGKEWGVSLDPQSQEPSGPFFRVVKECLKEFESRCPTRRLYHSDQALRMAIKRAKKGPFRDRRV